MPTADRAVARALVVGLLYVIIGVVTAGQASRAWRLSAWVLCLVVFLAHLVAERVRFGRTRRDSAWSLALGVSSGALLLALAGPVRSHWGTPTQGRALLAIVIWPLLLGIPAFLAGLAGSTILRPGK